MKDHLRRAHLRAGLGLRLGSSYWRGSASHQTDNSNPGNGSAADEWGQGMFKPFGIHILTISPR